MKTSTINKLALGLAALAMGAGVAFAADIHVATDSAGTPVRDSSGNCVLSSGVVHKDCSPKKDEPAPAKPAEPAKPAAPAKPAEPAKPAPASVKQSITIQAEALFDFDKSVIKPAGKTSLDDAISKLRGLDLEVIIATGHTDAIGTEAYNQKLSERRANAVKDYLVSKGVAAAKITTLGKGETQPVATNKTSDGRSKNRRVDVEFKGVKQ